LRARRIEIVEKSGANRASSDRGTHAFGCAVTDDRAAAVTGTRIRGERSFVTCTFADTAFTLINP